MTSSRAYQTAVYVAVSPDGYRFERDELLRDAQIRQESAIQGRPGVSFGMRSAREEDPETGTILDVDGDRSVTYHTLDSAEARIDGEAITVVGYREIRGEDEAPTNRFELVQWTQVPYSWVEHRDAERLAHIAEADDLTPEQENQLLAAAAAEKISKASGHGSGSFTFYADEENIHEGVDLDPKILAGFGRGPGCRGWIEFKVETDVKSKRRRAQVKQPDGTTKSQLIGGNVTTAYTFFLYQTAEHIVEALRERRTAAAEEDSADGDD